MMLISHYRHLHEVEGPFGRELILRGGGERLAPLLMTALVTALPAQRVEGRSPQLRAVLSSFDNPRHFTWT